MRKRWLCGHEKRQRSGAQPRSRVEYYGKVPRFAGTERRPVGSATTSDVPQEQIGAEYETGDSSRLVGMQQTESVELARKQVT
jgi:hypothetical protein